MMPGIHFRESTKRLPYGSADILESGVANEAQGSPFALELSHESIHAISSRESDDLVSHSRGGIPALRW